MARLSEACLETVKETQLGEILRGSGVLLEKVVVMLMAFSMSIFLGELFPSFILIVIIIHTYSYKQKGGQKPAFSYAVLSISAFTDRRSHGT